MRTYVPDTVAWAAGHLFYPEVGRAGSDGDTVVAGTDSGAGDGDVPRHLNVDAVGIGATARRRDPHAVHFYMFASVDHDVEQRAVYRRQPAHQHVLRVPYRQRLHVRN